jgi:stress response protein SCP2
MVFMASKKLIAGEKVKINDYVNSQHYEIHIQIESSMTIDICCFGLDINKKLSDDKYMVFYNQISSPDGAIKLTTSDQRKTVFSIQSTKLPTEIKNLVFTAAIDGNGTMSNISKGYLAFFSDSKEVLKFEFSERDFNNERAIIIGEVYFKDCWRLGAVGQGFNGGLSALLKHFGGEEIIDTSNNNTVLDNGFKYYYSKLDTPKKRAYEAMLEGINNFSENIHINKDGHIQTSSLSDLVQAITLDNPALFYLASNYGYSTLGDELWYQPKYQFSQNTMQSMESRLLNVVDNILRNVIKNAMTDYEKELALHDYLVKNVAYDYDSLSLQNPPQEIYSAYGAFINNKAVCSGYANAMKMLLDKCSIDCLIVTGDSKIPYRDLSVGHAWNIVKINNKFYHLDVTWDAPIGKNPDELFHHYFNITDTDISIDHKWDLSVPQCNANEHNYFIFHGLNITDDSALQEKLKQTIHNKKLIVSFRYTGSNSSSMNTEKLNTMISNVWENRFLSKLLSSGSLSWSTSYNERQKVFKVEFGYE